MRRDTAAAAQRNPNRLHTIRTLARLAFLDASFSSCLGALFFLFWPYLSCEDMHGASEREPIERNDHPPRQPHWTRISIAKAKIS